MNTLPLFSLASITELVPLGGLLVSVVAIITPFAFLTTIVVIKLINSRKRAELQHETIRLALEKGQPLPAELLNGPVTTEKKPKPNDRKDGLILIAVGTGIYFFLSAVGNSTDKPLIESARWAGLIPGLIGVAMIISWYLDRGRDSNDKS
jgi:uncharacterized protein DUF6249